MSNNKYKYNAGFDLDSEFKQDSGFKQPSRQKPKKPGTSFEKIPYDLDSSIPKTINEMAYDFSSGPKIKSFDHSVLPKSLDAVTTSTTSTTNTTNTEGDNNNNEKENPSPYIDDLNSLTKILEKRWPAVQLYRKKKDRLKAGYKTSRFMIIKPKVAPTWLLDRQTGATIDISDNIGYNNITSKVTTATLMFNTTAVLEQITELLETNTENHHVDKTTQKGYAEQQTKTMEFEILVRADKKQAKQDKKNDKRRAKLNKPTQA